MDQTISVHSFPAGSRQKPTQYRNISPRKGPTDLTYKAGLNGVIVLLYACSLAQAKQRAVEHFKPKKRDRNLVWVDLVG